MNTESIDQNKRETARLSLLATVEELKAAHVKFNAGEIKSVPFSDVRESLLAKALEETAVSLGVTLKTPLHLDSRAEFSVNAAPGDQGAKYSGACGHYTEEFVALLNQHNPRCGVSPGAKLLPENGWCHLFHFDAERMVVDYANSIASQSA